MLGIISDTHDNVISIKKAVTIFEGIGCDLVIHCGDVIAPLTIQFFKGLNMKFTKGNCDGDLDNLKKKAQEIGGEFFEEAYEFSYGNKSFIACHGNDFNKLKKIVESQKYDYVLTGHTHKKRDEKFGKTRVINPGAHYPTVDEKTVAVLDPKEDKLQFINTNKTVESY